MSSLSPYIQPQSSSRTTEMRKPSQCDPSGFTYTTSSMCCLSNGFIPGPPAPQCHSRYTSPPSSTPFASSLLIHFYHTAHLRGFTTCSNLLAHTALQESDVDWSTWPGSTGICVIFSMLWRGQLLYIKMQLWWELLWSGNIKDFSRKRAFKTEKEQRKGLYCHLVVNGKTTCVAGF